MFKGCECKQVHCDFNQLCFCQNYSAQYIDVTCVNVPLVSVPSFSRYQHLYRIRLIGVPELTQLKPNDFRNLITLASLSISKSRLSYVNPDTFKKVAIRHTLITLDLSYGNLIEIPVNALIHLHQLQWLSLKGNQIEIIKAKELKELKTLQTLLLNENSISIVEDRTFHKLPNLELIDFDGNMIERVEGNPFPPSLKSLSLSNCLLRKIPFSSIENLPNLQILQLHGNLISYLSPFKLQVDQMESIDLSHNLISNLPHNLFSLFNRSQSESFTESINAPNTNKSSSIIELNKSIIVSEQLTANVRDSPSLQIERFHLDFNFIQSLPPNLFRDILIKKLTLSSNRISSQLISPNAFQGPLESNLQVLDLNYNLIDKYPLALKSLRMLKQLLLKNNRIKQIDFDSFHKCSHTLEALDLSQNLLEAVPTKALSALKNLIKINLHDNLIKSVTSNELDGWCHKLKSLTLSKNVLLSIGYQTFNRCNKLSELRLGGNKLLQLSSDTLTHHLASLQLLDLSSLNVNRWLHGNDNVQTLPQVKWLQFDFNHLRTIPQRLIQLFPSLMYLDLQNNHISQLSNNLKDIKNLTTIILSHNNLTTISSKAFSELNKLENVALYFNRIQQVKKFAFYGLPRLQSLVLSKNQIKHIDTDAFYNLSTKSNTLTLMLDENHLECLSANSFRHITTGNISSLNDFALYLNVSHNQIKTLANCPGSGNAKTNIKRTAVAAVHNNQREQTLLVRVLDISFNQISQLTQDFLLAFCGQCLSLFVNNNFIRSLPLHLLPLCPHLQTLSINFNYISGVEKGLQLENKLMTVDSNTTDNQTITLQIQTLSLQHNRISELTDFEQLFHLLVHLKTLDLTGNQIKQIPTNIFSRTSIVKLNLAHNSLSMEVVEDKCFGIEHSLKYLDISYNSLTLLPNRIVSCSNLIELLVSNNRIHSFYHLMPLWKALSNLHRLELFNNPVQSIDQRISFPFVNNHSMLSILNLNSLNIVHLEELNVPYLFDLDLSENQISTINSKILSRSRNIRHLNLAFNKLTEVPKHIWKYVTRLRYLSLQDNPIEILDSSSFAGLKYLNFLDIRGLKLQYIDSRIFLYQRYISSINNLSIDLTILCFQSIVQVENQHLSSDQIISAAGHFGKK